NQHGSAPTKRCGTGVSPVQHGRDARATLHRRDAGATPQSFRRDHCGAPPVASVLFSSGCALFATACSVTVEVSTTASGAPASADVGSIAAASVTRTARGGCGSVAGHSGYQSPCL